MREVIATTCVVFGAILLAVASWFLVRRPPHGRSPGLVRVVVLGDRALTKDREDRRARLQFLAVPGVLLLIVGDLVADGRMG